MFDPQSTVEKKQKRPRIDQWAQPRGRSRHRRGDGKGAEYDHLKKGNGVLPLVFSIWQGQIWLQPNNVEWSIIDVNFCAKSTRSSLGLVWCTAMCYAVALSCSTDYGDWPFPKSLKSPRYQLMLLPFSSYMSSSKDVKVEHLKDASERFVGHSSLNFI